MEVERIIVEDRPIVIGSQMDGMPTHRAVEYILERTIEMQKNGYFDIRLEMDCDNQGCEYVLAGKRMENDDEYSQRIAVLELEVQKANDREAMERKLYELLKIKYGE